MNRRSTEIETTVIDRPADPVAATDQRAGFAMRQLRHIDFLGVSLLVGSFDGVAEWIASETLTRHRAEPAIISHINIANYYHLLKNPALREKLERFGALLFDGVGLKLGALILGTGWLPDLNGTDLFPLIMKRLDKERAKVFCLGSTETVVTGAVRRIGEQYRGLVIVGHRNGYFEVSEEADIVRQINDSGAQLLLIGCGFVKQERFSLSHRDRLRVSVVWNVGGLFDFVSGITPRAPRWMRRLKLEWLFRFAREPQRMWHRVMVAAPWVLAYVMVKAISGSIERRLARRSRRNPGTDRMKRR